MSANNKGLLTILTLFVLFFVCCIVTVFCEESSRNLDQEDEDDVFANQRELREYEQESWHAIHNTPEGASGWIPREPTDPRSGVVYTKRRRLRKRKRRPPIVSFADDGLEDNLTPLKKFDKDIENHKYPTVAPPEGQTTPLNDGFKTHEFTMPKRRKRPNVREPWEEMQEESVRPYVRRKVTPTYQISEDIGIVTSSNVNLSTPGASIKFGSENSRSEQKFNQKQATEETHVYYGKPNVKKEQYNAEKIENSKTLRPTTSKTPDLKAILKQNGGLSLSEILQQKNLTLSQLLTGNQDAIKALTESPKDITQSSTASFQNNLSENLMSSTRKSTRFPDNLENSKYTRLPPSVALKKNINRKYEQYGDSHELLSDKELLEAQKKRLALLQGHNYKNAQNGKFSEVTRYEVITEPTTDKRIFVPSHPKLYTSIDYNPELSKLTVTPTEPYISKYETSTTQKSATEATIQTTTATTQKSESTTQSIQQTTTSKTSFTKSKFSLPTTSAKLNKLLSKRVTPTKASLILEEVNYPMNFKPLTIDIKDVLGFLNSENQPEEKDSDEPYRMSIDLDTIPEKSTPKPIDEQSVTKTTLPSSSTEKSSSTSTSTRPEDIQKLKAFSAKDEIQEILEDPVGKERLAKILEARNMTIEELIEQRERGSSQLHLADIFHNKTKEPEPLEVAFEGHVSSEVFTSFPIFIRQPKALLPEEKTTQKPAVASSPSDNILVSAFPSFKIEVPKDLPKDFDSSKPAFPWKQLYPDLFNVQDTTKDIVVVPGVQEVPHNRLDPLPSKDILAEILTEDAQRLDDLDQRLLSSVSSEQLNIVDEKVHKIIKIPSGVQSAIVASLVIVGLSLIVFMTILVVFRLTQKRKTQMKYCDSLKPPLFEVKPKNIKTFVTKTLDKSKIHFYKNNLQNMSDVWERESERKSSF